MDLAIRKYNFIQELTVADEKLLKKLEEVLIENKKDDWYLNLSKSEQNEIEIGLNQEKNNELISHQTVMKKFDKWH